MSFHGFIHSFLWKGLLGKLCVHFIAHLAGVRHPWMALGKGERDVKSPILPMTPSPIKSAACISLTPEGGDRSTVHSPPHIFSFPSSPVGSAQPGRPAGLLPGSEGSRQQPQQGGPCRASPWLFLIFGLHWPWLDRRKSWKALCSVPRPLLHAVASGKALAHQFVIDPCHLQQL